MPPKNKRRSTAVEDDFISDDAPAAKKSKIAPARSNTTKIKREKGGAAVTGGGRTDEHGDEYWELTSNRRVTISTFKGMKMIGIREYYEKDGTSLPGKKGITMPVAQFGALITLLPHIEAILKVKGESLPRPEYGAQDNVEAEDGGEDSEDEEEEEEAEKKRNFEETSEED